ncbi:unnamed protein product [Leptidea sinapis]|uniref:Dynactin subunit 1 n=1 Tax=Leptidea sinapis TaxID=189913 RepID=A0A5E4R0A3_9NEOP|nr:unnamed protein product [Leptidea sinapis]
MSNKDLKIGQRVAVVAKDVKGTVAYVGYPTFASGKWIGINLDEPKGKNNGTVRGHFYFESRRDLDQPRVTASSRTSLASSRQSLASFLSPSTERASTPDLTVKRASFTGFVETLTPQFTPGQSMTSPQPNAAAVEEKLANLQAQQEITNLKAEVEDLKEKLETLRMRRSEDREKLRELERVRLQLDQANEFKAKIMESQAQLQRDLQRAKQEVREAQEALDLHNDETAELQEAAEMAALDKEMAEERAESIQMELEQCREKLEEATLDLQLMRAEMEASGNTQHPNAVSGGATGYEVRQLQQQNVRLKETLVEQLKQDVQELEALQEVHEQLVESNRELEMDLREEEAALETIMDRDSTIVKFRELVQRMTEQYNELTAQINSKQGDHDAILFILLLQRLNTKAEIILGQIRERFPAVNVWDREAITKSHTAVQYSFRCQLEYQLLMIQPTPPIVKRAQLVKKQLEETKTLTIRLEKKEAEYKELKKAAKGYKEELSEMNIRKELGEKKLTTAVRDAELKIDQLQRKLDDALNQIKRQEKEFDETLDHLQQDIESLEDERGALREKLKLYGKRGGSHHDEPSVKVSSGVPSGEVNEALQHQLKVLSW